MMIKSGRAHKVLTSDTNNVENGYLVELSKSGRRTDAYLTVAYPGCFKGYHLHKVREANYVCIRGRVRVILFTKRGKQEFILSSDGPDKLHIPMNIPTGISNEWSEEAWLVNFPNPAYDPELKDEQIDFTEAEAITWLGLNRAIAGG